MTMSEPANSLDFNLHPVYHGQLGWTSLLQEINNLKADQLFVIADSHTLSYCYPLIKSQLSLTPRAVFEIPPGEASKSLEICESIWQALHRYKASRKSLIINIGGGVVTDIGGFCASVYKRGIPYVNIPTSLLGMVDASIGGKTGIDHQHLKNVIGSFYPPVAVWIDRSFLSTLPLRECVNGYAELIKHALIADVSLWEKINTHDISHLHKDLSQDLLLRAAQIKCQIVDKDPKESGVRKTLNFGHTIGHAIESLALQNNMDVLHGEAVAMGMEVEAWISHRVVGLPLESYRAIGHFLRSTFPYIKLDRELLPLAMDLMYHDKKNINQKVSFSLLPEIGNAHYDVWIEDEDIITEALWVYIND